MTKSKAIKLKCLDCAGDSPKEVTLCHLFSCPLWPFRIGASIQSKQYRKRMEVALQNFPEDIKALTEMGVDISFFLLHSPKQSPREKSGTKPIEVDGLGIFKS